MLVATAVYIKYRETLHATSNYVNWYMHGIQGWFQFYVFRRRLSCNPNKHDETAEGISSKKRARARELIKHNLYICAMIFCLLLLVVVSVTKGYQIFSIMPNLFWKLLVIPSVKFYGIQRKTSIPPRSLFLGAVHNLLLPQLNIFILMPHRLIFYFAFHLLLLICLRRFSIAHRERVRESPLIYQKVEFKGK